MPKSTDSPFITALEKSGLFGIKPSPHSGGLVVSEQFYSVQGEGRYSGTPSFFLRLTGCNLLCGLKDRKKDATWTCDTFDVWRSGVKKTNTAIMLDYGPEFVHKLRSGAHVVVTGGEPLRQQGGLISFLQELQAVAGTVFVEIETNATVSPDPLLFELIRQWNVSPKLSNSGEPPHRRLYPEIVKSLAQHAPQVDFKFVVKTVSDWDEIVADFIEPGLIDRRRIILMPGCDNRLELQDTLPRVAAIAKTESVRMCSRLQIEVWNEVVGV